MTTFVHNASAKPTAHLHDIGPHTWHPTELSYLVLRWKSRFVTGSVMGIAYYTSHGNSIVLVALNVNYQ